LQLLWLFMFLASLQCAGPLGTSRRPFVQLQLHVGACRCMSVRVGACRCVSSYVGQDIFCTKKWNGAICFVKVLVTSETVTKTVVGETRPVVMGQTSVSESHFCF
jgi:hypothetical protein